MKFSSTRAKRMQGLLVTGVLAAGLLSAGTVPANAAMVPPPKSDSPASVAKNCKSVGGVTGTLKLYGSNLKNKGKVTTSKIHPGTDYMPVLFVHGWNTGINKVQGGDNGNTTFLEPVDKTSQGALNMIKHEKSLVGMVQDIPNTAAFYYDYSDSSDRWVTQTYEGLGKAIDCLYKKTHEKVTIIAHSMGGLNTRVALARSAAARKAVGKVITFGTPVLGSKIAREVWAVVSGKKDDAANTTLDPFGTGSIAQSMLSGVLFNCSQQGDAGVQQACGDTLFTNFNGDAGRGLRVNSRQMKAVASLKWPKSVHTLALYGDLDLGSVDGILPEPLWNLKLDGISSALYAAAAALEPKRAEYLDLKHPGDGVVSVDSARYDAYKAVGVRCAIFDTNINGDWIAGSTGPNPLDSTCFHSNLMRSTKLAQVAVDAVQARVDKEITGAQYVPTKPTPTTVPTPVPTPTSETAGWTLSGQGLGPVKLWQHSEDAAASAKTSYAAYINRVVANESSHTFCRGEYYTPLLQDHNTGLMVGFDSTYDSRSDPYHPNSANESINSILVRATGVTAVDAKLPKTDKGIGIGSSAAQVFAAYGNRLAPQKDWLSGGKLIETTDERHQQGMTKLEAGDQTFTMDGYDIPNSPFGFSGYLSFKTHNGIVTGMSVKSGLGLGYYSDPEFECGSKQLLQ